MKSKYPHVHINRFTIINRQAMRKGYRIAANANGSWTLRDAETGQAVPEASSTDFDSVAAFLQTQPLL